MRVAIVVVPEWTVSFSFTVPCGKRRPGTNVRRASASVRRRNPSPSMLVVTKVAATWTPSGPIASTRTSTVVSPTPGDR